MLFSSEIERRSGGTIVRPATDAGLFSVLGSDDVIGGLVGDPG